MNRHIFHMFFFHDIILLRKTSKTRRRAYLKKLLCCILILLLFHSNLTFAESKVTLSTLHIAINDALVSTHSMQWQHTSSGIYMPIRPLAEALGVNIHWNSPTASITMSTPHKKIELYTTQKTVYPFPSLAQPFDLFMESSTTMVSAQQMGQLYGYQKVYLPNHSLIRFKDNKAKLTDLQVAAKIPKSKTTAPKEKTAYLSFDDGPSLYTGKILDILDQYNINATFFFLKKHMAENPKLVQRIVNSGHTIGVHGVTHNYKVIYASPAATVNEMNSCNDTLENITGFRTKLVRVPYGSKPQLTKAYRDALVKEGYRLWDWNVDSGDSKATKIPSRTIINTTKKQIIKQKTPVILFHEKQHTVEALPDIINFLNEQGFMLTPIVEDLTPVNFWNDIR